MTTGIENDRKMTRLFERCLTVRVGETLCQLLCACLEEIVVPAAGHHGRGR